MSSVAKLLYLLFKAAILTGKVEGVFVNGEEEGVNGGIKNQTCTIVPTFLRKLHLY